MTFNIYEGLEVACAVIWRRFPSGCKSHPSTAPAGSNRSSYGGNEMAKAFNLERLFVAVSADISRESQRPLTSELQT